MARDELARFAVGRMGVGRGHPIDRREVSLLFRAGVLVSTRKTESLAKKALKEAPTTTDEGHGLTRTDTDRHGPTLTHRSRLLAGTSRRQRTDAPTHRHTNVQTH